MNSSGVCGITLGQKTYLLQMQRHSHVVSLDQQNVCCIDNVALVLPTKVSQLKLACLMEGHRSSSFLFEEACLIEWYQVRRHICLSFTERHPCPATRPSHQTSLPSRMLIMCYLNSTRACYRDTGPAGMCVCYIASAIMYVTITKPMQFHNPHPAISAILDVILDIIHR